MKTYSYKQYRSKYFPIIDILAIYKKRFANLAVLVDSGASISIFSRETAKQLGVDIKKGELLTMGGVGGFLKGYIHHLRLEIADKTISAPVVFSTEFTASFNLLGRMGVFDNFKIVFDEKNLTVSIST